MANAFKLNNNQIFVTTEAPGGVYSSEQLKKIAEVSDEASAIIKATEDHRLAFFVAEDKLESLTAQLAEVGIEVRHYQSGAHQPVACVGGQCPMQEQDALNAALEVTDALDDVQIDRQLKVGINGCFNSCVPAHTLDISIVGETNGYKMSIGGKTSLLPEFASFVAEGIPADKLPMLVAEVAKVYNSLAEGDETLHDVLERAGAKAFIEATAPYSQDAAHDDPFEELNSAPDPAEADTEVMAEAASEEEPAEVVDEESVAEEGATEEESVEATSEETLAEEEVVEETNNLEDDDQAGEPEINVDSQAVDESVLDEEFILDAQDNSDSDVDIDPGDLQQEGLSDDVLIGADDAVPEAEASDEVSSDDEIVETDQSQSDELVEGEVEVASAEDMVDESSEDLDEVESTIDSLEAEVAESEEAAEADETTENEEVAVETSPEPDPAEEAGEMSISELEEGSTSEDLENTIVASDDISLEERESLISDLSDSEDEIDNDQLDQLENSMIEQAAIADLDDDENSEDRDQTIGLVEEASENVVEDRFIEDIDSVDISGEQSGLFASVEEMSTKDGSCSFNFSSGAKLAFDIEKVIAQGGRRELIIDEQKIVVEVVDGAMKLSVDDMEVSIPSSEFAAA